MAEAATWMAISTMMNAYSAKRQTDIGQAQTKVMEDSAAEAEAHRKKMERMETLKSKLRQQGVSETSTKPVVDSPYAGQGFSPMTIKRRLTTSDVTV